MDSLFILIPIALVFCALAIKLLLWAIDSGQYDDLDKEASRILMDDEDTSAGATPSSGRATSSSGRATSSSGEDKPA
jgi:cbb3-type cytochrome oxidase maturation protein